MAPTTTTNFGFHHFAHNLRRFINAWHSSTESSVTGIYFARTLASGSRYLPVKDQLLRAKVKNKEPILSYTSTPKQSWLRSFETGQKLNIVNLDGYVFGACPRIDILHRVVVWQRAKIRSGTAKVKNRGEVRGGGRKPYKQKGSGRARQGSIRAPHFRGGGVVHGPRGPISYKYTLPKKVRAMGLRTALSIKYAQGDLYIVDHLQLPSLKTSDFLPLMDLHGWSSVLLVDGELDVNLCRATSNLQKVNLLPSIGLNVYSMLLCDTLVLSLGAVRILEERLLRYSRSPDVFQ